MIWFVADTHYAHKNIIQYCNRPFSSIEEHDQTLIANWNGRVQKNDIVYHLGDFGWDACMDKLKKISSQLNGRIHLIKGNHDRGRVTKKEPFISRFESIQDVLFLTVQHKGSKHEIFLSHYPHRSWNKSFHGSIHLFGHVHGKMKPHGLSFDVGVDCWNYQPVSLDEVLQKAEELKLEWKREDSL